MSMSEFFLGHSIAHAQHGIGQREESWDEGESSDDSFNENQRTDQVPFHLPLYAAESNPTRRKRQRNCILDESSLDDLAERHGYTKIKIPLTSAPLASYRRGVCRLNFWLTTGNVGSYLDHPTKGKHLLVRRDINLSEAESVFQFPMHHVVRDYRGTKN